VRSGVALVLGAVALFGAAVATAGRRKGATVTPAPGPFQGDRTMSFAPPSGGGGCDGAAWYAGLPPKLVDAQSAILQAVANGCGLYEWTPVQTTYQGHTAIIPVFADALRIGSPESAIRVAVDYRTAQQIADALGGSLLTSRVSDAAWQQADARLTATKMANTPSQVVAMANTSRMLDHSQAVDAKLSKQVTSATTPLVGNAGKDWVVTKRWAEAPGKLVKAPMSAAANYGWYEKGAGSWNPPHTLELVQPIGLRHGLTHVDYSQQLRLMGRTIEVDGQRMEVADVMRSPELAGLVSDEGILPFTRHPLLGGALPNV